MTVPEGLNIISWLDQLLASRPETAHLSLLPINLALIEVKSKDVADLLSLLRRLPQIVSLHLSHYGFTDNRYYDTVLQGLCSPIGSAGGDDWLCPRLEKLKHMGTGHVSCDLLLEVVRNRLKAATPGVGNTQRGGLVVHRELHLGPDLRVAPKTLKSLEEWFA